MIEADIGALLSAVITHPTQDGLDPRHQLPRFERLGHVVVSPQFQADNAVGGFAASRQHQDRDIRFGPQPPANR